MCKHSLGPCRACGLVLAFLGAKPLLIEQELERQKEKERAQGDRGGATIPSCMPQFQHLFQCSGRSSRKGREQRFPARLCTRSSFHTISPSTHLKEALAHLQLPRRTKLPPNPPLLPGQLQTTCLLELSSLDSLGEAPSV